MAVVAVNGPTPLAGINLRKNGKRLLAEEQWEYLVETDDVLTTRREVLIAAGLPIVGQTLSTGGITVASAKRAERTEVNRLWWKVTVDFSSEVEEDTNGSNESQSDDPTNWFPLAEASFETYQFYGLVDVNGVPFRNSAGAPFSSSLPLTRRLVKYEFEQFEAATTTLDEISDRNETVNSATFVGKPAKTLLLHVKKATIGYYYGYRVWRVEYAMVYNKDTWKHKVLDVGPYYLSGGNKVPFKTPPPLETAYMGFLTPTGGASATSTTKEFDRYESQNFASFLRVRDAGAA